MLPKMHSLSTVVPSIEFTMEAISITLAKSIQFNRKLKLLPKGTHNFQSMKRLNHQKSRKNVKVRKKYKDKKEE